MLWGNNSAVFSGCVGDGIVVIIVCGIAGCIAVFSFVVFAVVVIIVGAGVVSAVVAIVVVCVVIVVAVIDVVVFCLVDVVMIIFVCLDADDAVHNCIVVRSFCHCLLCRC